MAITHNSTRSSRHRLNLNPTIAQVQGYAIGAGTYWVTIPDITIAADDAYFQIPLPLALRFPTEETMMEP